MLIVIDDSVMSFGAALRRWSGSPESCLSICEVATGKGEFRNGRGALVTEACEDNSGAWLRRCVVRRLSGPVVYGADRRARRARRALARRVGLQRDRFRYAAAAIRADRRGALGERHRLALWGGPHCWCGRRAVHLGRCLGHDMARGADV